MTTETPETCTFPDCGNPGPFNATGACLARCARRACPRCGRLRRAEYLQGAAGCSGDAGCAGRYPELDRPQTAAERRAADLCGWCERYRARYHTDHGRLCGHCRRLAEFR